MSATIARPETRGELKRRLEAGERCEVPADNAGITTTLLHGWLAFDAFTVAPSENEGWSVFAPAAPAGRACTGAGRTTCVS